MSLSKRNELVNSDRTQHSVGVIGVIQKMRINEYTWHIGHYYGKFDIQKELE